MTATTSWRSLLPPLMLQSLGRVKRRIARPPDAVKSGPVVPWSPAYSAHKERIIGESIRDENILQRFRFRQPLPDGYGVGIDERCIEYPWLVAQLTLESARLLDAGSTLNYEYLLTHPIFKDKRISILTLAPEPRCFWRLGVSYLFGDLRDLPIRDEYYDTVACLSTLEHVGFDNTFYTGAANPSESSDGSVEKAIAEINRVLKPGGRLCVTVPFGRSTRFREFVQFDEARLADAVAAFVGAADVTTTYYRYSFAGWQMTTAAACADSEYVEWITGPRDQWPAVPHVEPDLAAAARAVACVRIVKESAARGAR